MPNVKLETKFEPEVIKANKKNEITMHMSLSAADGHKTYWCECDIIVSAPLSLAHDKDLNMGRTRIGILKPAKKIQKQIKLYTTPNTHPDYYPISITAYLYDEDGAIAERAEQSENIKCEQ